MVRLTDSDMTNYVWDYAAYPASLHVSQEETTPSVEEESAVFEQEETLVAG